MTGLQEAFYIVALVYMGVSLLIIVAVLVALGVIRQKIVNLERMVQEKIDAVTSIGSKAGEFVESVRNFTKHKDN